MDKQAFIEKVKSLKAGEELKQIEMTLLSDVSYDAFSKKFYSGEQDGMKILLNQNAHKARAEKLKQMLGDDDFNALKAWLLDQQKGDDEVKLSDIVDAGCGFVVETAGNGAGDATFCDDITDYRDVVMRKCNPISIATGDGLFDCEFASDWVVSGTGDNPFRYRVFC